MGAHEQAGSAPACDRHVATVLLRVRLEVPDEEIPYPVCREMRAKGCTDYVLLRLWSDGGPNNVVSFCSGAEGGFRDAELALLESLLPVLALRVDLCGRTLVATPRSACSLAPSAAARASGSTPSSG